MTLRMFAADLGASGGKCFCAEIDDGTMRMHEVHRFAHESVPYYTPEAQGTVTERLCWDDALLHHNIVAGLQACRRQFGPELDSIAIDTWGADGNLFSENGDMLGKMYCYRDHRLDTMIDEVKSRIDARRVYDITGIHFQPFNLSNQLLWLLTRRQAHLTPGVFYLPVPSLFTFYLGGERKVDSTWASVTQLMDARTCQWSGEILAALGIPEGILPEIVPPGSGVGTLSAPLAESIGLNRAKLVATASHDTASAFAAAAVDHPEEDLIISSGTWSLLGKLLPAPITSPEAMAMGISNEGGIRNIRFLKNCMGTWIAQELRRTWAAADGTELSWTEMTRMAEGAPPFGSFIDPDDQSFYNPQNMETAIAEYCDRTHQAVPEGRGALLRLVYESLALKYRFVNEQICSASSTKTCTVHIVGGGCRNELLNRFTAEALGLTVFAGPEEATAVGNIVGQALALGAIADVADAKPMIQAAFPIRRYEPVDPAPWIEVYRRFQQLCGE